MLSDVLFSGQANNARLILDSDGTPAGLQARVMQLQNERGLRELGRFTEGANGISQNVGNLFGLNADQIRVTSDADPGSIVNGGEPQFDVTLREGPEDTFAILGGLPKNAEFVPGILIMCEQRRACTPDSFENWSDETIWERTTVRGISDGASFIRPTTELVQTVTEMGDEGFTFALYLCYECQVDDHKR